MMWLLCFAALIVFDAGIGWWVAFVIAWMLS